MAIHDTVAVSPSWRAIGTTNRVLTTDPSTLERATAAAQELLFELDLAASRFRADSELSVITAQAARHDLDTQVSPLLGAAIAVALDAAGETDGLVDPTIGSLVVAAGYDADLDVVRRRGDTTRPRFGRRPTATGWQSVGYDRRQRRLRLRRGTVLDLGATAKAYAADLAAERLTRLLPGGFLVDFGGDLACAGTPPEGGWLVGLEAADGSVNQVVTTHGAALATSSTQLRTWVRDGERRHHIVDPRTGHCADVVWAQVTCAAETAVRANAAATAAIILGHDAPDWLHRKGIAARLDRVAGRPAYLEGWPIPQRSAA